MNLRWTIKLLAVMCVLFATTLGCNMPNNASPTPDLGGIVAQTQTAIAVNQFLATSTVAQQETPISSALPTIQVSSTSAVGTPSSASPTSTIQSVNPGSTGEPANCSNKAKFLGETVPDNSIFAPGQEFIKTWTLQNIGTCTWSPEYSLVFIRGEQMNGTSPSPIGQSVPPGGSIQVFLPQKAPSGAGEHQGFWKLRSPAGQEFGLGNNADVAFWTKINVVPGTSNGESGAAFGGPQNLGAPSWVESFNGKNSPWFLGSDSGIDFDLDDGHLIMTVLKPIGDQWRVAQPSYLSDFYLQGSFKTGSTCSGKDGYGLIVRAPDSPSGAILSGYIFSFSCDGKYRIYRMDNGNFDGIQNWATSPTIKSGPNQSNVMGVYGKAEKLQLYSNGVLIYEFTDSTYSGGLFGLVIRSENTTNFQVLVDEVASWIIQ